MVRLSDCDPARVSGQRLINVQIAGVGKRQILLINEAEDVRDHETQGYTR